jgi:cell division ATPase FtsA
LARDSPSPGLRHGYVVNKEEVADSIREAKRQAEIVASVAIRSGFLSIGGISLDESRASGEAVISRADQEITDLDIEKDQRLRADLRRRHVHESPHAP